MGVISSVHDFLEFLVSVISSAHNFLISHTSVKFKNKIKQENFVWPDESTINQTLTTDSDIHSENRQNYTRHNSTHLGHTTKETETEIQGQRYREETFDRVTINNNQSLDKKTTKDIFENRQNQELAKNVRIPI